MDKKAKKQTRLTVDWARVIPPEELISDFHVEALEVTRVKEVFCTGSEYEGTYNVLGFSGTGRYIYPHGVIYEGEFKNGKFHGHGTMTYPMGQKVTGEWEDGKLCKFIYLFKDGLEYKEPWRYCRRPDRRFQLEVTNGLIPAGAEKITNDLVTKNLQENCYDTINGYYNDTTKAIYTDKGQIRSIVDDNTEEFIKANYRFWIETPVGYRPDLYEEWTISKMAEDEATSSMSSSEYELNISTDSTESTKPSVETEDSSEAQVQ